MASCQVSKPTSPEEQGTTEMVNNRNINVSVFPFKEEDPDTGEIRQGAYLFIDSDHPETWTNVNDVVHPIIQNIVNGSK